MHKHRLVKKQKPYGAKRKLVWCRKCDAQLVIPEPVKKRERQKAKKLIREEATEITKRR